MPIIFDADGNEHEIPVEITDLKSTLESATQFQKQLSEKEELLKTANDQLEKLASKELNFKKLRDMSEAEKEKFSTTELSYKQQIEKLEEEVGSFKKSYHDNIFQKKVSSFVGSDATLKEKVEKEYENINMPSNTEQEVEEKIKRAYVLATGKSPSPSPMFYGTNNLGGLPPSGVKLSEVSDDVKDLGKKMGLSEEDFKKYSK